MQHTLLPTTELLNPLLLVILAVERHADAHARVILDRLPSIPFLVLVVLVVTTRRSIGLALDDEPPTTGRHEPLEDVGKLARDLLEGAFDGLVLALVEDVDELDDGLLRRVQLGPSLDQRVPLLGEVVVLLKGLLVHVSVLLQAIVHLVKSFHDLDNTC